MIKSSIIESSSNKIYKQINALKTKKERDKSNLFILEGVRLISEIPKSYNISYYALSQSFLDKNDTSSLLDNAPAYILSDKLFSKLSETVTPQGIFAAVQKKEYSLNDAIKSTFPFLVILENISDPGNLGTIIRTADAAGADAVLLSKGCVDLYNPKVIRSTMGSVFHLPVVTDLDLTEAIDFLHKNNVSVYAAHLKAKNYPYSYDFTKSTAILIGNEANGLTDNITSLSDNAVKLPMIGSAESMNASVACSILLYEVVRQRL
ncbi:MAG: RNA methyltransferase [Firmicutes bacterium]|nr:RNA methyltransferase [Bacillota bacterium]